MQTEEKSFNEVPSDQQLSHKQRGSYQKREKRSWFHTLKEHAVLKWLILYWKKFHITKLLCAIILTIVTFFTAYLVYSAKTTDVESLKAGLTQSTVVYDAQGEEAGILSITKGEYIPLSEISPHVVDAVLSTEDKRFYSHIGVDPIGLGRAVVNYILHFGQITGGGSTITQQLAKNAYLTADQTLMRKAKELFLSFEIERRYTKDEILEMYLNKAYFGNGAYGIANAAKRYFGKTAAELTVGEAAVLAGALKAPSYYNPIDNMEATIERREIVLQLMVHNQKLSAEEATAWANEEIYLVDTFVADARYRYPYFFDAVIDEAVHLYGISEEDLMNKGYQIYTGLNQTMQAGMEETFSSEWLFPTAEDGSIAQAASIALDPQSGNVLATVGGRVDDQHTFRGYNRATQLQAQPGSTYKPLVVYTVALEEGYAPDSVLKDERLSYGSDQYTPENYNFAYQGEVTMTEAIQKSWNAPAVWLLDQIGLEKGIEKARQFGLPTVSEDHYLGIALGGVTTGVSPLQMASAYTVFANQGVRSQARFITKIVDATGRVIVDNTTPKTNRVTTKQVADEMTSMMLTVYDSGGSGAAAAPSEYIVAGKTGTTESIGNGEGSRDQWMIAYTPDVVVATWMGHDGGQLLASTSYDGVAPLFHAEMDQLLIHTAGTPFTVNVASTPDNTSDVDEIQIPVIFEQFVDQANELGRTLWDGLNDWANEAFNW